MRVTHTIFADTIIRDADRNTLSIIDLYESFELTTFPAILARATLCYVIERDATDNQVTDLQVVLITPNATQPNQVQADFKDQQRTRVIVRFEGFVIFQPGEIRFELRNGDNVINTLAVSVTAIAPPPAPN